MGDVADTLSPLIVWALGFWVALMAILPLGHVTALRTGLALPLLGLAIAVAVKQAGWQSISKVPGLAIWLALLTWCGLSAWWSPAPDVTWSKFRFDLLIPFLAYVAAYHMGRFSGAPKYLLLGPLIGTALLAALSLFAWLPIPDWIKAETQFGTYAPMPFWYPGVGEASAYSVLLFGPLLAWWVAARRESSAIATWGPALAFVAILAIIVASNRRNALVVLLLSAPLFFVLFGRDGKPLSRKFIGGLCAAFLLAVALVAGFFEYGARERMSPEQRSALAPNTSAALILIKAEPRPKMWAYYLEKASQHPWRGVGFGRTVPAVFYDTKSDQTLASYDAHAATHAHNLALNWVLQTGVIGLAIFATLLIAIARRAWRKRTSSRDHRLLACAVIATIFAMLLRNMTDDFLVYGIAIMFWAMLGVMLGLLDRRLPFDRN